MESKGGVTRKLVHLKFAAKWSEEPRPPLSDALCRIITGGGISKRKLYTDGDQYSIGVKSVIGLNGIGNFVTRGDLQSRSIIIDVPFISPKKRKTERELIGLFQDCHPAILADILRGVSIGLQNYDKSPESLSSRLADLVHWTSSWTLAFAKDKAKYTDALEESWKRESQISYKADLLGEPLLALCKEIAPWKGTMSKLMKILNKFYPDMKKERFWPKTSAVLGSRVMRLMPAFRDEGVVITKVRKAKKRYIKIEVVTG